MLPVPEKTYIVFEPMEIWIVLIIILDLYRENSFFYFFFVRLLWDHPYRANNPIPPNTHRVFLSPVTAANATNIKRTIPPMMIPA